MKNRLNTAIIIPNSICFFNANISIDALIFEICLFDRIVAKYNGNYHARELSC